MNAYHYKLLVILAQAVNLAQGHFIEEDVIGVTSAVLVNPMGQTTAEDRGKVDENGWSDAVPSRA